MRQLTWFLLGLGAAALAACDVVRVPGDGREPPPPPAEIPDGAPGPPPPQLPVDEDTGEVLVSDETDGVTEDTGAVDPVEETEPAETDPEPEDVTQGPPIEEVDPEPEPEPLPIKFQYYNPGDLIPGTGTGRVDEVIYAPDMVFPISGAPAHPQSMVFRPGGAVGGDQCDTSNFTSPWRDNFCEKRSTTRNTPLCPTNKVHQGQDIRVGTAADCETLRRTSASERTLHEAVAVEDGIIQYIGTYSVQLKGTTTGNIYSYLHLNMAQLRVAAMDTVSAGDTIGFVSNDFGGTPTTFHLHFEIKAPIEGEGIVHVPPFTSLVAAYERREEGRGEVVEDDAFAAASLPVIPDDIEIIE